MRVRPFFTSMIDRIERAAKVIDRKAAA